MNTTENKSALIPEGIVYTLFDQSKRGHEINADAIRELAIAVNGLTQNIITPPMNKDVIDVINKHDGNVKDIHKTTMEAIQNHDLRDETRIGGVHNALKGVASESDCTEMKTKMGNTDSKMSKLSNKVIAMISVVLITFSIMTVSYLFVRHGINTTIQQCIENTLEDYTPVVK